MEEASFFLGEAVVRLGQELVRVGGGTGQKLFILTRQGLQETGLLALPDVRGVLLEMKDL